MSLRRIAAALDLSPSAVSLALRNSPKIPDGTRARVLREAERIGYRPNAKLKELMSQLRHSGKRTHEACFGVISLYDTPRPWESSLHLTRVFRSMEKRADELGYRLEPMWLKAPGMTIGRFGDILDTRGVQGLLCFGSPILSDPFPRELDHYAIVAQGLSIATPLHRVTSHFYNDLSRALSFAHSRGYRRPGLVLGCYEEERSAHAYSSAYLGWCEHTLGNPIPVPILRTNQIDEKSFLAWLAAHRPDVVLFVHLYTALGELQQVLARNGIRAPQDVGIVAISQILEGTSFTGMQQNQQLMGAWAVELLVGRIHNQDFGIPAHPRIEMVESNWIEGATLRPPKPT
ncbi:MAG TPA: LacI family DNA-binding transcriptional regulator [Opitutaceae bacterium]|nr:LacI family DNA-binding transcriptional regulator [Opitutaceae bacterium]